MFLISPFGDIHGPSAHHHVRNQSGPSTGSRWNFRFLSRMSKNSIGRIHPEIPDPRSGHQTAIPSLHTGARCECMHVRVEMSLVRNVRTLRYGMQG